MEEEKALPLNMTNTWSENQESPSCILLRLSHTWQLKYATSFLNFIYFIVDINTDVPYFPPP